MMLDALLSAPNQRSALAASAPKYDAGLVAAWREAATVRERENPQAGLAIAGLLATAAELWQHEETAIAAQHVEANALLLFGEQRRALTLFETAAMRYRGIDRPNLAAQVAVGQIAVLQYLGRYDEAATLAERALADADDELTRAKILLNSGIIAARQSEFEWARDRCLAAIEQFRQADVPQYVAIAQINAGNVLTELNDFRQAEQLFQAARTYCEAAGQTSVVAQIDIDLAYLLGGQGAYQAALIHADRARATFAEQGNAHELAIVDLHRSDFYLALNLWHETQQQVAAALPYFEREGMAWEIGRLHLNRATALAHSDQFEAAIGELDAAAAIFSAENNPVWQATTNLYRAKFLWQHIAPVDAESISHSQDVFRAAQLPNRVAQCAILLGNIALANGDLPTAESHFTNGLRNTEYRIPTTDYQCHDGLAQIAEQRDDLTTARQQYRAAIAALEQLHAGIGAEDYKLAFLSDKLAVYERLVELCLRIDSAESRAEAFETVERARSRVLLDQLARSGERADDPLDEFAQIKQELNWYYNRLNTPSDDPTRRISSQLNTEIAERERQLLAHYQQNRDRVLPFGATETASLAELQAALPDDMLLIEQFMVAGKLVVFGISAETLWVQTLTVDEPALQRLLAQLRFQISKFRYNKRYRTRHAALMQRSCDDILGQLYELIWRPIAPNVTTSNIVIVPYGTLHALPFHALFDGERYLLDKHTVSLAPSATVFLRTGDNPYPSPLPRPSPPTPSGTLSVGTSRNILIVGVEDETIPHAVNEAQTIAAMFDGGELRVGDDAMIDDLADYQLLHLASHATFRADNPLFSALKLADGWLTVHDLYRLKSAPPLVTLSACDTHQHQVATGDELMGLARGFFAAGSRTLVVSSWMVDDAVTATLMCHFYRALQSGMTVAAAMRTAQLAVRDELAHPYYWAAFVVTGNPGLSVNTAESAESAEDG